MEAVIFVGIQASGKSTFYRERFFGTHIRINLDMLKTRNRERILVRACLDAGQSFVVDNTNVLVTERATYIAAAKEARFRVIGYFFRTGVSEALRRNSRRSGAALIPPKGLVGTYERLEEPSLQEGFDTLFEVHLNEADEFMVREVGGNFGTER